MLQNRRKNAATRSIVESSMTKEDLVDLKNEVKEIIDEAEAKQVVVAA